MSDQDPKLKLCPSCGGDISKNGHYVPPSFGDKGFWACEQLKAEPPSSSQAMSRKSKKSKPTSSESLVELIHYHYGSLMGFVAALEALNDGKDGKPDQFVEIREMVTRAQTSVAGVLG